MLLESRRSVLGVVVLVTACGGDPGPKGQDSLVAITAADEQQCPDGGSQINVGGDKNRNGELDTKEIESSWPVCSGITGTSGINGALGANSLIAAETTAATDECPFGGVVVHTGTDLDVDGVLDASERSPDQFFCSAVAASFPGLVYTASTTYTTGQELFAVGADGLARRRLAASAVAGGTIRDTYQISADRRNVAFCGALGANGEYALYVKSLVSDRAVTQLTSSRAGDCDAVFAWAPKNSDRLAFITTDGSPSVPRLYTVLADGGGRVELSAGGTQTLNTGGGVKSFAWAPNDSLIAYVIDDEAADGVTSLYTIPPSGLDMSGTGRIGPLNPTSPTAQVSEGVQWSPSSLSIAFAVDATNDQHPNLYVASATTGGARMVSGAPDANIGVTSCRWSPDGSRLAYVSVAFNLRYALWIVDPAATTITPQDVTGVADNTAAGVQTFFGWSADSARVAFSGIMIGGGTQGLYAVAVADGTKTTLYAPGPSLLHCAWSPAVASSRLACRVASGSSAPQLWLIPAGASGANTQINGNIPDGHTGVGAFSWSPDGAQLAFTADPTAGLLELFVAPSTGGASARLSQDGLLGTGVGSVRW